jgi:hypothetical protein
MSQTEHQFSLTNAAFCRVADSGRDGLGSKKAKGHREFSPMKLTPFVCGLLALSTPMFARALAGADAGLKNAVILVIRHAEKPDNGDGLSKAGKQRAKAYVKYFENFTLDSKPLKVDYLFAAADSKASHRPRLTLEPFSKAVGVAIDARFNETQPHKLAAAIQKKPPGRCFLICWHHGEIPQLVSALGADPNALFRGKKWPDDVYDWVIQLRYESDGHLIEAKRIKEKMMPGDSGD